MKSLSVDGLEALPLGPELPVRDNGWGDGDTQLLSVSKDAVCIVGTKGGRGDTSKPADEVEVILTGPRATKETARGEFRRNTVKDQVADVGDMIRGSLEETVLGLFRDIAIVYFEKATVNPNLLFVEVLKFSCFRGGRDTLKRLLT